MTQVSTCGQYISHVSQYSLKALARDIFDSVSGKKSPIGVCPTSPVLSFLHYTNYELNFGHIAGLLKNFMRSDSSECSDTLEQYIQLFCEALFEYAEIRAPSSLVIVVQRLELLDMICVMYQHCRFDHTIQFNDGRCTVTFIIPPQMISNSRIMMVLASAVEHTRVEWYYSIREALMKESTFNVVLLIKN